MALKNARKKPRRHKKTTIGVNTEPTVGPPTMHILRRALEDADAELAAANAALLEVPAKGPDITQSEEETTTTAVEHPTEHHHYPHSPVPMQYDGPHDPPTEMLIGQAYGIMRQLSDLARASVHHRYAAESMYSELCSYRSQSPNFDPNYYNYGMQGAYSQPHHYNRKQK